MFDDRIYTFLTLYKQMNYHRTADILSMTQPGVTQHIQYLEKQYGVKFFRYEGRTLYRTPEAELFKKHLDSMMAEERAMREEFVREKGLRLRIGATKTIGEFVLTPVVDHFLRDPSHSLEFVIDNTQVLLRLLEEGQLDFAVVEGVFDKNRHDFRLFRKEKFTGICTRNHPFAGKTVDLEAVLRETLIGRINLTNAAEEKEGKTLTELLARRDVLTQKISILRSLLETAGHTVMRGSRMEVKIRSTVDVAALRRQSDDLAKELRILDTAIQSANWLIDLR